MNKKVQLFGLSLLTATALIFSSGCKKPSDRKVHIETMNGQIEMKKFSFNEILDKLPQSVLYNLGDQAKFYTNEAETQSYSDGSKILRFPISEDRKRYIYAVKGSNPDDEMKIFLRHIIASTGTYEANTYTAVEDIIDVESWTIYRQEFTNNRLSKYYDEITALTPGWEKCAVANGDFMINGDGLISENPNPPSSTQDNPYKCPPNPHGGGSGWLRRTLERVGEFFRNLNSGDGLANDAAFYPPYTGSGGYGIPPSEGGTGGGGTGNPRMGDPRFNQPHSAPGFEHEDLGMIWVINPSTTANDPVLAGNYSDGNGYINNRKTAMAVYLHEKPYGMLKCADLEYFNLHIEGAQDVASFQVPQAIEDRVSMMANNNMPDYNTNNTFIQKIQNADGAVNLDHFPVRIQQLPKKSNGQTMTPLEFLEYFRLNLSHASLTNGSLSSFSPYADVRPLQGADINEIALFNSPDVSALGAWVHIDIPMNDGSVILTDYHKDDVSQIYWFTFTTMANYLDGTHPITGNRRFGIQPHPNGGWQFYTLGVDRVWGFATSWASDWMTNWLSFHPAFDNADELWSKLQDNVVNFINQNQGQASLFPQRFQYVRVEWDGAVSRFLTGEINLQQLKAILGCP